MQEVVVTVVVVVIVVRNSRVDRTKEVIQRLEVGTCKVTS